MNIGLLVTILAHWAHKNTFWNISKLTQIAAFSVLFLLWVGQVLMSHLRERVDFTSLFVAYISPNFIATVYVAITSEDSISLLDFFSEFKDTKEMTEVEKKEYKEEIKQKNINRDKVQNRYRLYAVLISTMSLGTLHNNNPNNPP